MTCKEFLNESPLFVKNIVKKIREAKKSNYRPRPSESLIDNSLISTGEKRNKLLDKIAILVDENLTGRSNKCEPFADLLQKSLNYLGIPAKTFFGTATYYNNEEDEMLSWFHAWVTIYDKTNNIQERIDGNIHHSLIKEHYSLNPMIDTPLFFLF